MHLARSDLAATRPGSATGITTWFLPHRGVGAIAWAVAAGFDLVHLDANDLVHDTAATLADAAHSAGVTLAGLSIVGLESRTSNAHAMHEIDAALALASDLGIDYCYLPAFGTADIIDDTAFRAAVHDLRYAASVAPATITIATENSLSTQALSRLLAAVDNGRVEVLFDTQNPAIRGHAPAVIAADHADRVRTFAHVKDGTRALGNCPLGTGWADIAATLTALVGAGFVGRFVIESDYRTASIDAAQADLAWLSSQPWIFPPDVPSACPTRRVVPGNRS